MQMIFKVTISFRDFIQNYLLIRFDSHRCSPIFFFLLSPFFHLFAPKNFARIGIRPIFHFSIFALIISPPKTITAFRYVFYVAKSIFSALRIEYQNKLTHCLLINICRSWHCIHYSIWRWTAQQPHTKWQFWRVWAMLHSIHAIPLVVTPLPVAVLIQHVDVAVNARQLIVLDVTRGPCDVCVCARSFGCTKCELFGVRIVSVCCTTCNPLLYERQICFSIWHA